MAGDSTMVVRALLRDEVTPQLARIAAAVEAMNKTVSASDDEATRRSTRNNDKRNQELFKIDNAMRGVGRRMASRVVLIGAAIAAASGQAVALTDALWPMIGALGAIPAVAFGGLAGIAALVVGLKGLGAAMKTTGGGAGVSADQIASAEHRIAQAQKASVQAQRDVNDAREQAVKDLRDMAIEYARANLNVQESALAVKDAELALRQARSSGNREDRTKAELALQEALLSQQEAQNKLTDTTEQYNKMQAQGVENSDTVQTALQRQADATYELAQAQKALADAQKGGGGADAAAEAYAKLSDAGKSLVDTFKSLKPAWADVAKLTQQHLLAGVDDDIKALSTSYLPVMKAQLPAIADGWNTMFHAISDTAKDSGFVADMNDALGDTSVMFKRIGHAFGPLLDGFRQWVHIGSDFLPRLGSWVDRMAGKFDNWSKKMRATGQGAQWIENSLTAGHQFNQLLGSWASSLGKIFALGNKPGFLQALVDGSKAFQKWLDTAEGQDRITRMWERLRDLGSAAWTVIKNVLGVLSQVDVSPLTTMLQMLGDALGWVNKNMSWLGKFIGPVVTLLASYKIAAMGAGIAQAAWNASLGKFIKTAPAATKAAEEQAAAQEKAAGSAKKSAGAFAGMGNAITLAITGVLINYQVHAEAAAKRTDGLADSLDVLAKTGVGVGQFAREIGATTDALTGLGNKANWITQQNFLGRISRDFLNLRPAMGGVPELILSAIPGVKQADALNEFDAALVQWAKAGGDVNQILQDQNIQTRMANGQLPQFAQYVKDTADKQRELGTATDAAVAALQKQNDLLHKVVDPVFEFIDAQRDLTEKQKAYTDAVNQFGQDSPQAQAALEDLAKAQFRVRDATVAMQSAGPEAIKQLQIAQQQGYLTGDAYNYLYNQIMGVRSAMGGLQSGYADPNAIARHYGLQQYDTGGTVPGPEGKPQLAVVHGGETVIPADVSVGGMPAAPPSATGGGGSAAVTFEFRGVEGELTALLAKVLRKAIRVNGAKSFGLASA